MLKYSDSKVTQSDKDIQLSGQKIGIAIPTYNEKANLAPLIERLFNVFKIAKVPFRVVIIDDNSPDGTGELADSLAERFCNISVIHRTGKLGLGSAYKAAFQFLLNDPEIKVIMEMDADFSHQPEYIPKLLSKIADGYDVAIGSRYIKGGGIDKEWTAMRRIISKSANVLAVMFAGLNVKDATGGFRAYDSYALKTLDLSKVRTNGYAFQIDMLAQCKKAGCEIAETPITFYERKHGKSKLARSSILEFIKTLEGAFFSRIFSMVAFSFQSSCIWFSNTLWIGIKPLKVAIKRSNEQNLAFAKRERVFSR